MRTHLTFFTFFPAIYSTYNGSARKNRAGFSHVRICGLQHHYFPGKYVHIYNRLARRKRIWRLCWLVAARFVHGHILPRADINSAQIGTGGATRLRCNLHSQLVCSISYKQVTNRHLHIILRWKNV